MFMQNRFSMALFMNELKRLVFHRRKACELSFSDRFSRMILLWVESERENNKILVELMRTFFMTMNMNYGRIVGQVFGNVVSIFYGQRRVY